MKSYYAYIRVSTAKQGQQGSSLQEQRDAITLFAGRHSLHVVKWFEERETAAKIGRQEFSRMVAALKHGKASGVVFHKIDRSARNLKDWSAIQDLAELGIDVKFTQESINLGSNEGKLTGDFLAVIAAHYIRNLREEVRKGIRGRLKQGLYPFKAFIGYLDRGGGKPKAPDPERAPFIRLAFDLYATGRYSLATLAEALYDRGFRTASGRKLNANRLATILRNPFYIGIIRMKGSGETYVGLHEPIIPRPLFGRVQNILDGKIIRRTVMHDYLFRRIVRCARCKYSLVGERQKGRVYYRCHTRSCPPTSLREDLIDLTIRRHLTPLNFSDSEVVELRERAIAKRADRTKHRDDLLRAIDFQINANDNRASRLTDVFLDGAIERSTFEERKLKLVMERDHLEAQKTAMSAGEDDLADRVIKYVELLNSLDLSYETANPPEKRKLLSIVTSNLEASGKELAIKLKSPFLELANDHAVSFGGPHRRGPRTFILSKTLKILLKHCEDTASQEKDQDPPPPVERPRQKGWENIERANRQKQEESARPEIAS